MNFRPIKATDAGHLVLVSGEVYGNGFTIAPRQWGLVVGNPRHGAQVLTGSRDDVLAWLDRAREELVSYAVAEHENGYHLGQPEDRCPECQGLAQAFPPCSMSDGCGAAAGQECAPGCPSRATDDYADALGD